jgi:16S rRNA (guanine1207-N2)-methyltransferase
VTETSINGLYGHPPAELVDIPDGAVQFSPLVPPAAGASDRPDLESLAPGGLASMVMLAPPGTAERRYALALSLRALPKGAQLTVLAPKSKGGSRLRGELESFGCAVVETSRRHHRICTTNRPDAPIGLDEAIAAGAPRLVEAIGLWSQPGLFSWDRLDPGSALLVEHLPALSGRGADLGCGAGFLAHAILASPKVTELTLVDVDRRAIECTRRNVLDPRAKPVWADARTLGTRLSELNFVVMNPPFHENGNEDQGLGQGFIRVAAAALRRGGTCWLVANRHLPYEAGLREMFSHVEAPIESGGYKIYEARK